MTGQISDAAATMILGFEVGSESHYVARPDYPGGASGVTIGIGYDLGYASADQIGADWAALPSGTVIRLQSCAGRRGKAAETMLFGLLDIVIPWAAALDVYRRIDLPRYSGQVLDAIPNAGDLPDDCFGALVSLIMNRGASMSDPPGYPDARMEMRDIRDAGARRDWAAVPGFLWAMKRLWVGKGQGGLLSRRDAEAAMFEAGLASVAAPPDPPPAPDTADALMAAELETLNET